MSQPTKDEIIEMQTATIESLKGDIRRLKSHVEFLEEVNKGFRRSSVNNVTVMEINTELIKALTDKWSNSGNKK